MKLPIKESLLNAKMYGRKLSEFLLPDQIDLLAKSLQKDIEKQLTIPVVVGQSKQLSCSTCKWLKRTDDYCDTCFKFEKYEPAT